MAKMMAMIEVLAQQASVTNKVLELTWAELNTKIAKLQNEN